MGDFLNLEAQGGGPVIDIGTHALDLALWMMDNYAPKMVLGKTYQHLGKQREQKIEANPYGSWNPDDFQVEDFGVGMAVMENGATVTLEASWLLNRRREKAAKITLCGTKAGADMDDGLTINGERGGRVYDQRIELNPPAIPFYAIDDEDRFGPALEIREWLDAVQNDTEPVVRPRQMLTVMRVIEGIYRSAESGEPVLF